MIEEVFLSNSFRHNITPPYNVIKEQNGLLTSFRNGAELCQVIVKSEQLKDAIQELTDVTGAVAVCVQLQASDGMLVRSPHSIRRSDIL